MAVAVKLGHASTDNKPAAEQVKIGNYYSGGWTVVLRPTSLELAAKSALICEACCNNNKILYSQANRNTLRNNALKVAGYEGQYSKLSKITVKHIESLGTCYADCSSLMTFCATVGGASIEYSGNAPVCSTMRAVFTNKGSSSASYKALTSNKYLTSSAYLQRGDILVNEHQHAVMVLDNGSEAPEWKDPLTAITTTKIVSKISKLADTQVTVKVKLIRVEDGKEKLLSKADDLNIYNWSYKIESLETAKTVLSGKLNVTAASSTFTFVELKPNTAYSLSITASEKKGKDKLNSSKTIFTTPLTLPTAVHNFNVKFNNSRPFSDAFEITFDAPSFWGASNLQKCYRLSLIVNGQTVAYKDSIFKPDISYKNKKIQLDKITTKADVFTYNDLVQIGIQPGLKDSSNRFFYDPANLKCSKPFYVKNSRHLIDKLYVKMLTGFKRVILYNNR